MRDDFLKLLNVIDGLNEDELIWFGKDSFGQIIISYEDSCLDIQGDLILDSSVFNSEEPYSFVANEVERLIKIWRYNW